MADKHICINIVKLSNPNFKGIVSKFPLKSMMNEIIVFFLPGGQ